MRLSEKTIELNVCSQWAARASHPLIWFGLTQVQERQAGFDIGVRTGARLALLQFKASNRFVFGRRRFNAPHHQLSALQKRVRRRRSVFLVLPDYGETLDLRTCPHLLHRTYLLDVSTLPPMPPPTTRQGTPRKSKLHYIDLNAASFPPTAIIHSEEVSAPLLPLVSFFEEEAQDQAWGFVADEFNTARELASLMRRHAIGLLIPGRA